ncbi:MAG: DUF2256 and DUF3253 domain-containing protein [Planctomycetota bacterium]|nr:DUF2256 and DUF3253 domain-containing protein [Planctomycetota bacterium]
MGELPTKVCRSCGREFSWRKKWERDWESVRYCSDRCRRRGAPSVDERLEHAIRMLLCGRPRGATICPSEAARAVCPDGWRELMEPARMAARRLEAQREVEITQGGRVVDPSKSRGPIRVRLVRAVGLAQAAGGNDPRAKPHSGHCGLSRSRRS